MPGTTMCYETCKRDEYCNTQGWLLRNTCQPCGDICEYSGTMDECLLQCPQYYKHDPPTALTSQLPNLSTEAGYNSQATGDNCSSLILVWAIMATISAFGIALWFAYYISLCHANTHITCHTCSQSMVVVRPKYKSGRRRKRVS